MLITKRKQGRLKKAVAVFMLLTIVNQILTPTVAYALTSGPTAPEATNFEPIDTTDVVNPLTGSFTYSVPLLEVPGPEGGYPLALSYHAGIQPNEEASWVGLGWSLNPGAIARNVNGYPDDWKESSGLTRSVWTGGSTETYTGGLGIGYGPASVNANLSFSQDTYQGYGIGWNAGVSLNLGSYGQGGGFISSPFSIGGNVGVSAYGGAYVGANVNYTAGSSVINGLQSTTSIGVQTNFNSVKADLSESVSYSKRGVSLLGASISTSSMRPSFTVGGGSITSVNNPSENKISTSSSGFSFWLPLYYIPVTLSIGYNYTRYWSDNSQPVNSSGVLYNRNIVNTSGTFSVSGDDDNYQLLDPVYNNIVDNPDPVDQLGGNYPNFDNYSVTAQGLGGNIRPYIFSSILYNQDRVNRVDVDHSKDSYGVNFYDQGSGIIRSKYQFRFINDLSNSYQQSSEWSADVNNSEPTYNFSNTVNYGNNDGQYGYDESINRLEGTNHIEYFTNDQINDNTAAARGFIDCDAAGFVRGTNANTGTIGQTQNPTIGKQIGGFMITNSSGVTYHYALPAYSYAETQRTENEPYANLTNRSLNKMFRYTDLTKNEAYAYTWYLTAITGPDYVSRGSTPGKLDTADWGYWVKFDYGKWADKYRWRNPSEGANDDSASPGTTRYASGLKELYYLDAVETRTHTAIFEKEIRADGKSCTVTNENTPYQPQAFYYPQSNSGGYVHPQSTLRLNNVYLFQNDQLPMGVNAIRQNSTVYDHVFNYSSGSERVHYGLNVIDKNDINAALKNSCLRKIALTYDYSSAMGCPNSYDPGGLNTYVQSPSTSAPSSLLGKLTLLAVDFQGKGGAQVTPPTTFQYELDASDPANTDNLSLTKLQTYEQTIHGLSPAIIQTQTPGKFKKGDILSFSIGGIKYYCTLLHPTDNTNQSFTAYFLDKSPDVLATSVPATRTKNPPYNKDAFDNWGYYKSDFGETVISYPITGLGARPDRGNGSPGSTPVPTSPPSPNTDFIVKQRPTSSVSNSSTDVWSLRKVSSGIGSEIRINYESNTYNRSALSKNKSVLIDHDNAVSGPNNTLTFPVNPMGIDLNTAYKTGDVLHMGFLIDKITGPSSPNPGPSSVTFIYKNSDAYPTPAIIKSVRSEFGQVRPNVYAEINEITIQVDPQMAADIAGYTIDANLTVNANFFYGGGVRVKDISVDDLGGNIKKTSYNYNLPGPVQNDANSSGVTSFEPLIFPIENLFPTFREYANYQAETTHLGTMNDPTEMIKQYRRDLYAGNSQILSIAREAPGPGVMYEYVTTSESNIIANGTAVPVNGKTMYQYEVFKPEMIGIYDYNDEQPVSSAYTYSGPDPNSNMPVNYTAQGVKRTYSQIITKSKRDRSIKDYTSRIGCLKRVVTYDNSGNKLTEKINHYLHDDLENTSFQTQVSNYEPRLSSYNGIAYNNMGVIKERYGNARLNYSGIQGPYYQYKSLVMMSNKETFPTFQTGTTQIDYKNGTKVEQTNLAYDFYTGAVTKTLTIDSYGNRFVSQATPAYTLQSQYSAMGLKTHDDNPFLITHVEHKQMLTQQASNYTFSVDINNNPIGVVTATAQTWSNNVPVQDPGGNLTTTGQSNIWRLEKSLSWMPAGNSINNVTPYSSFGDYYAGGSGNSSWKKTNQITRYNVYSAALEASDINESYAATRMGYNNSKVLISGGPAKYSEIAYTGAEDALLDNSLVTYDNGYIEKGNGIILTDSTRAHTGLNSLRIPAASSGFRYTVPITSIGKKDYAVAVWVKPSSGNADQAQLFYQVGAGTAVQGNTTLNKSAAGWYLLEMTIPANALTGTGNLVVGCKNGSSADLYFDDFKFQPMASSAIAYVYDKKTGELTYIIGNNNLFTRFQYDEIGRLVRTYKEVLGKTKIPIMSSTVYHYGKSTL